jgi:hypothetical protein
VRHQASLSVDGFSYEFFANDPFNVIDMKDETETFAFRNRGTPKDDKHCDDLEDHKQRKKRTKVESDDEDENPRKKGKTVVVDVDPEPVKPDYSWFQIMEHPTNAGPAPIPEPKPAAPSPTDSSQLEPDYFLAYSGSGNNSAFCDGGEV